MGKKQTAIEWFIEQLTKNPLPQTKDEFIDGDLVDIINKAKEMEKQQIKNAWFDSTIQFDNSAEMTYKKDFEQYYNETFKKD